MRDIADLLTFDDFITHWAEDRPDRPALREEDREYTYGELEDYTARVAAFLTSAGLKKGDRIAWIGKNSDLYFELVIGASKAGAIIASTTATKGLMPQSWAITNII